MLTLKERIHRHVNNRRARRLALFALAALSLAVPLSASPSPACSAAPPRY